MRARASFRRRRSWEAFRSLVDAALAEKVAFVVIAGDVYDGEWRDASIGLFFNRELARLDRAGIGVFLLKGNHDAESVVTKSITLPPNVREFQSRAAQSFRLEDLKVVLHGRSFPDRIVAENYALAYPPAGPGWFNIGVLHTSCTGRPPRTTLTRLAPSRSSRRAVTTIGRSAMCTSTKSSRAAIPSWSIRAISRAAAFARRARKERCSSKSRTLVLEPRRLILDKARWALARVDLQGVGDEEDALSRIEQALGEIAGEAEARLVAVRVELLGATPLNRRFAANRRRLRDEVQAAAHRRHRVPMDRDRASAHERAGLAARRHPDAAALDPISLIAGLEKDAGLRAEAEALLSGIAGKLPASALAGEARLSDELDALMGEAVALVLGRLEREDR